MKFYILLFIVLLSSTVKADIDSLVLYVDYFDTTYNTPGNSENIEMHSDYKIRISGSNNLEMVSSLFTMTSKPDFIPDFRLRADIFHSDGSRSVGLFDRDKRIVLMDNVYYEWNDSYFSFFVCLLPRKMREDIERYHLSLNTHK